jgi:cytochrome P450
VLARAKQQGTLDDVLFVNLIYMVEMGRYDVRALLRWLTKHASNHPLALAVIRAEASAELDSGQRGRDEAFVLETLRTDQSERLMRRSLSEIVFDDYRIPKGALVRLCMWESHHDAQQFNAPQRFDPCRFASSAKELGEFAPFGLDRHKCPFGEVATAIGISFLRALASFEVQALNDTTPVRGAYHWEPSSAFSVSLVPRRTP